MTVLSKFLDAPRDGAHRIARSHANNQCFLNAADNLHGCYRHYGLRQVYGSLAMGGWWEFGGKTWGAEKFRGWPANGHGWLEDCDGNIYDYVQPSWAAIAEENGRKVTWPRRGGWLEGVSKADAQKMGLTYLPANAEAQKVIKDYADKAIVRVRAAASSMGDGDVFNAAGFLAELAELRGAGWRL
jgi:hypothetical protein